MSKYSEKVAARRVQAAIDVAVRVTEGAPPPAPAAKTPPPEARGILVDLGALPANCASALADAADALDRAAALGREMLRRVRRSIQKSEAISASLLAETTAPRIRAAAVRLRRMPAAPVLPDIARKLQVVAGLEARMEEEARHA